jgi:biopolymer transport protein ExbD
MKLNKHNPLTDMEMNMTPMIDVVFLLIIFFMIITDLTQQELEDLELPVAVEAHPDEPNPEDIRPILNVMHDGRIIVKKKEIYDPESPDGYKEVEAYLADHADKMRIKGHVAPIEEGNPASGLVPDDPLLLRVDQVTEFRMIQKIMEVCGKTGIQIWKVELAAAEEDDNAKAKKE